MCKIVQFLNSKIGKPDILVLNFGESLLLVFYLVGAKLPCKSVYLIILSFKVVLNNTTLISFYRIIQQKIFICAVFMFQKILQDKKSLDFYNLFNISKHIKAVPYLIGICFCYINNLQKSCSNEKCTVLNFNS